MCWVWFYGPAEPIVAMIMQLRLQSWAHNCPYDSNSQQPRCSSSKPLGGPAILLCTWWQMLIHNCLCWETVNMIWKVTKGTSQAIGPVCVVVPPEWQALLSVHREQLIELIADWSEEKGLLSRRHQQHWSAPASTMMMPHVNQFAKNRSRFQALKSSWTVFSAAVYVGKEHACSSRRRRWTNKQTNRLLACPL